MTTLFLPLFLILLSVTNSVLEYDRFSSMLQESKQTKFMSISASTKVDCIKHKNGIIYIAMNNMIRVERINGYDIQYIPLDDELQHGKIMDILPFPRVNSIAINVYFDKCHCSTVAIIEYDLLMAEIETKYLNRFEC